ncbi:stage II sporulation protein M [Nocardia halotolerans]|uniref:Stage II sporulation protein M n=1 Tax=Nocardia halotolerans TaxID=1755878 RepID=A0ABV8VKF6_9NOCA
MDTDAYSWAHQRSWYRLDQLVRQRKLSGAEADELVRLYRTASQQLAKLQGHHADPDVVAGLSALLARARGRVLAARAQPWREVARFFTRGFPEAVYRVWPWWVGTTVIFLAVSAVIGALVDNSAAARRALGIPDGDTSIITGPGGSFESYYSEHPNDAFAAQVWTHNSWVAAIALFTGVLILPAVYALLMNALNLGITGGLMADAGRLDSFFGFILPHGTLELTALFVAGGVGLKLGWTLVDPGRHSRATALARQGRATATVALGLVVVLLVCGLLEGFVTPSGLPAPVRIAFGFAAEALFLVYVFGIGRRVAEEQDVATAPPEALPDPSRRWLAPAPKALDRA